MKGLLGLPVVDLAVQYPRWRRQNVPDGARLAEMRDEVERWPRHPLISVITPVYETPERWLRRCIESVREQIYPDWELCLVDDGSTQPHVLRLLQAYAAADARIRVEVMERNRGMVVASSRALAMARGEWVALLDHDDELAPEALFEVAKRLSEEPDLDFVYSDEDKLDPRGSPVEPFFKPDFCPDLLMGMNYVCHLAVYRRSLVDVVGGFRAGFEGSQDWDLALRVVERTRRIAHIPKVLYHWRMADASTARSSAAKPYAQRSGQKALEEALTRRGHAGHVKELGPGLFRVGYVLSGAPLISVVIPTRDRVDLLRACVSSILEKSTWRKLEIVVADNDSSDPATLEYLAEFSPPHRVLPCRMPFNWSAINNLAAREAKGGVLVFLNNDTEVIAPGWIEAMLEHAQRSDVGAVGAKLLYPDGTIQHAGIVLGIGGRAGHAYRHHRADHPGYVSTGLVAREYGAVTGACLMVRRETFEAVNGFDERYRIAFGDVDFCLRLRERGLRNLYAPEAVLFHRETASRGKLDPPEDGLRLVERWASVIAADPHYSPNLTRSTEDFGLELRVGGATRTC